MPDISHQLFSGQTGSPAFYFHWECEAIRGDAIQCFESLAPGRTLNCQYPFFRFTQGMRCESSQGLQMIPKPLGFCGQPGCVGGIKALPPEVKKHQAIGTVCQSVPYLGVKRPGFLIFRIF